MGCKVKPEKEETRTARALSSKGQSTTEKRNFADPDAVSKRLATVRAQLAIKGFVLRKQVDGTFLISKWDYCREVTSIDAAARFLEKIGGAR